MQPILYSFRRCPYAMRARLALALCLPAGSLELREIILKNKPAHMLDISPKGTVPVLQLVNGNVIEESIEIMHWALAQADLANGSQMQSSLYPAHLHSQIDALIARNDGEFKHWLDRYKYADRYEHTEEYYREQGLVFLTTLNEKLSQSRYLMGDALTLADLAIFPFVRQFAHVDRNFLPTTHYQALQAWLSELLDSEMFTNIMKKYPVWQPESVLYFP